MPDLKQELSIKETFHNARDNVQQQEEQRQEREPLPEQRLRPTGPVFGPMANQVDMAVHEDKKRQEYLDELRKRLPKLEEKPKEKIELDLKKDLKKDFDRSR